MPLDGGAGTHDNNPVLGRAWARTGRNKRRCIAAAPWERAG